MIHTDALSLSEVELGELEDEIRTIERRWHAADEPVMAPTPHIADILDRRLPALPSPRWRQDVALLVAGCRRNHSPRFWGYVMGSGNSVGALGAYLGALLNQNVTSWRSAPAATQLEHITIGWLAEMIGYQGLGYFVSGGSMANFAALCMARAAKLREVGRRGVRHCPEAVLYASQEVHLSIGKACDMLGLGRQALRLLPTDAGLRLRCDALVEAIEQDRRDGRLPIAVVASAGTASTGAVDPLDEIAGICQAHDLWLHVDGAYGALAAAVRPDVFLGLAKADSVSLDCHKWLYAPIDASCVLYKNPIPASDAFSYHTDFTAPLQSNEEAFTFFDLGPELTRPFRALKVWMMLSAFGADAFRQAIDKNIKLAHLLGERLAGLPDFEVMAPVSLSICCFRYRPSAGMHAAELDELNRRILLETQRRGRVYMSNTAIGGRFALRVCVTNHRTTESDWDILIDEIRTEAKRSLAAGC